MGIKKIKGSSLLNLLDCCTIELIFPDIFPDILATLCKRRILHILGNSTSCWHFLQKSPIVSGSFADSDLQPCVFDEFDELLRWLATLCKRTILHTGWRSLIGCLKLQVILHKRATNYSALLQKITYEDKASYDSTPPCIAESSQQLVEFIIHFWWIRRAVEMIQHTTIELHKTYIYIYSYIHTCTYMYIYIHIYIYI